MVGLIGWFSSEEHRRYESIQEEVRLDLINYNNLLASSVHFRFNRIETLLDIISIQLLFNDTYKDPDKALPLIDGMMRELPDAVGYGLVSPKGEHLVFSKNIDPAKLTNLMDGEFTRETFIKALESNWMVPGRVYFYPNSKSWILPLRKAIRRPDGEVVGVISTGIAIDHTSIFVKALDKLPSQATILVNNNGLWRICITPPPTTMYKEMFLQPMTEGYFQSVIYSELAPENRSMKYAYNSPKSFLYSTYSYIAKKDVVGAIKYLKEYDLWIATHKHNTYMWELFIERGFYTRCMVFILTLFIVGLLAHIIIKREERSRSKLAYQAIHDNLTKLRNRNALEEIEYVWMAPNAEPFILIFIDLDNFKNINDAFGHSCGDLILQKVAKRLKKFSKTPDVTIVRLGGDEFGIFMKMSDVTALNLIGSSLIRSITKGYHVEGMKLHLGCSVGISQFPKDGNTLEQIMIAADLAMYSAKSKRNNYAIYNTDLKDQMHRRVRIEHELRPAIGAGELYMVYQPQLTNDGELYGCEALVRWENDELGFVPPDQFINIAEEAGLMQELGVFILQKSCSDFAKILEECPPLKDKLRLSINISVKQMLEENFKDLLIGVIDQNKLARGQVTIEITESLFIENLDYILPLLNEIQGIGIVISLDDFGTGYSSLSMLRALPINELKIDRSFINNICVSQQDSKMANSIIDMGHTMGISVLAEGIEEEAQLKMLNEYGCDLYQGYYFSKPLKPDAFVNYLNMFCEAEECVLPDDDKSEKKD